ncbi:GNAT family N-acetyltransferase [Arthrobacter psychrochitiniphilus]|uniref:GNAT family N-acetyltransferase n=1 Tax=Arthrobacter psychrochitiniphilus TaxID=291045 RepID=UPI001473B666
MVSLSNVQDGAAELGYWIDPLVRAQGVMTEAAARVVAVGFAASPRRSRPQPYSVGIHLDQWIFRACCAESRF